MPNLQDARFGPVTKLGGKSDRGSKPQPVDVTSVQIMTEQPAESVPQQENSTKRSKKRGAGRRRLPLWAALPILVIGLVAGTAIGLRVAELSRAAEPLAMKIAETSVARTSGVLSTDIAGPRSVTSFEGYGTWIDVFDYSPVYATAGPKVSASDVEEMAALGVKTLYVQAARLDSRSPMGLVDPWLLAEILMAAHHHGIDVVAWYLPKWSEDDSDLQRVQMLRDFEILGNRFDGVALDIEWIGDLDVDTRNERLVALSRGARRAMGPDPLAAIVLPPVLTEVVNTDYWPDFPWTEISNSYDVWMPMSYWSFRSQLSGYGDGYAYNEESTRRLRENLGDPTAAVHGIGGIGGIDGVNDDPNPEEPLTSLDELDKFVTSLVDTGSIGGSVYDWATLEPEARQRLAQLFGYGPGSQLPPISGAVTG